MEPTPINLEDAFGLSAKQAAELLGLDPRRYYEFRNGTRDAPRYIRASIRAHLLLTDSEVNQALEGVE